MNEDPDPRRVFVVHGRNDGARRALFEFLRSIGLHPLEWSEALRQAGKGAPFVGEVLDAAFDSAQAVVVLFTGDDVSHLRPELTKPDDPVYESTPTAQARPNVIFEAGMALGRHPERTIFVEIGTLRPISDLAGRHMVRMKNDLASRQDLATRLQTAGCPINLHGTDWHTSGDFSPPRDLPQQDAIASSHYQPLSREELEILRFLARSEATSDQASPDAEEVAGAVSISLPRAKHFLEELEARDLVYVSLSTYSDPRYSLTPLSRKLLVKLGEI